MSNLNINVVALGNFGNLQTQLAALSTQIAAVNKQLAATGTALTLPQIRNLASAFDDIMMRSGQFTRETVKMSSAAEQLGERIARNRVTFKDVAGALGNLNKQTNLYNQLGQQQVKMSRSIVQGIGGGMANVYTATAAGMETATVRAQVMREAVTASNAALKAASTQVINFGKNTQWAGRQLTAGLSMPLVLFGGLMAAEFYKIDQNLTRLARVYGVGLTQATTAQLSVVRGEIMKTSQELARSLGVSAQVTTDLAAELAAAGLTGEQLISSTKQAARITVLGEVDKQEAVKATIALQTAYKLNTSELTDAVNFFNAAQAATSTNMRDLVEAVPKVGPVIKGLGGSYKDLVAILTSMKEGGVPASEAANAIKNSLGRIINPTKAAQERMMAFGINLKEIVSSNAGDLIGMLTELQSKLDGLTDLQRSQAISEIFGKYQFARMTAFFDNFNKAGTQSAKVMQMMGMSSKQLEEVAKRQEELIQQSASGKFQIALQQAQQALLPVGSAFLSAFTDALNLVTKFVDYIDKLPDSAKNFLKFGAAATIIIGPLVMATGLFANFFGTIAKGLVNFRIFATAIRMGQNPIRALTESYRVLTPSIVATERAAAVFGTSMGTVAGASQAATRAITAQITALQNLQAALSRIPATGVAPPPRGAPAAPPPRRRSDGTPGRMPGETGQLPGYGGGDIIPALLEPGEFVVNKVSTKQNLSLLHDINQGRVRKRMSGTPDGSPGETMDDAITRSTRMGIESVLTPQEKELESILTGKEKKPKGIRTESPSSPKADKITTASQAMEELREIKVGAHIGDKAKMLRMWFDGLPDTPEGRRIKQEFLQEIQQRWQAGLRDRQNRLVIPTEGLNENNFHKYLKLFSYRWEGQTLRGYPDSINKILGGAETAGDEILKARIDKARSLYATSQLFPDLRQPAKHFESVDELRRVAAQGAAFDVDTAEKLYHYSQAIASEKIEKEKRLTSVDKSIKSDIQKMVTLDESGKPVMSKSMIDLLEKQAASTKNPTEASTLRQLSIMIQSGATQDQVSGYVEDAFVRGITKGDYQVFFTGPGASTKLESGRGADDPKKLIGERSLTGGRGTISYDYDFPAIVGGQFYRSATFGRADKLPADLTYGSNIPSLHPSPAAPRSTTTPSSMKIFFGGLSRSRMFPLGFMPLKFALGGITPNAAQFLGAIKGVGSVQKARELREILSRSNMAATTGRFADMPVTQLGERASSIGGMSSAIPGINGVYNIGNGKFVVKVHDTPESALAEVRGTQLTRDIFGLVTPNQQLIKIKHPVTGDEMFAVASPYDKRFAATTGKIGEDNFYDQALASVIRRDKDLQPDNLYDNIVTDVGSAYVANKASQPRVIGGEMPSVREQIETNFLMVKGGAKKWFAESTAGIASKTTPEQYEAGFKAAIARAESRAQKAIDDLPDLTPEERKMYMRLIDDLKEAQMVDWKAVHTFHKDIVPEVKKPPTAAAIAKKEAAEAQKQRESGSMAPWDYGMPFYFSGGGKIPGFGGGDIVPAMVEPGEFVVNKDQAQKFAPMLQAINSGDYKKLQGGGWGGSPGSWRNPGHPGNPNSPTPPPPAPPKSRSERMKEGWANAQNVGRQMARNFSDGVSRSFSKEGAKEMARGAGRIGKDLAVGAARGIAARVEARMAERERIRNMTPEQRQAYDAEKKAARQEKLAARQMRTQRFQGVGMAAMMGSGTIMQMTGGGNPALNYGLMGAGMGSMFGPWGLAIGAAGGALAGLIQMNIESTNKEIEARQTLAESIHKSAEAFTTLEQDFLGVEVTDLLDMDTSMLNSALVESSDKLRDFTEALKNAEEGTVESSRIKALAQANSADELINSPAFRSIVNQAVGAGVGQKRTIEMLMGYLNASDQLEYATAAQEYVMSALGNERKFTDESGVRRQFDSNTFGMFVEQSEASTRALEKQGITLDKALEFSKAQAEYDKLMAEKGAFTSEGGGKSYESVMGLLQSPTMLQGIMSMYLTAKAGSEFTTNAMGGGVITGLGFAGQDFLENPDQGREYITELVEKVLIPALGSEGVTAALASLGMGDKVGGVLGYGGIGTSGEFQNILAEYMKDNLDLEEAGVPFREAIIAAAETAKQMGITPDEILQASGRIGEGIETFGGGPSGKESTQEFMSRFLSESGLGTGWEGLSEEQITEMMTANISAIENVNAAMQMLESGMENTSGDALSNLNRLTKSFEQGLIGASQQTIDTFNTNIDSILTKLGPEAQNTFNQLKEQTGSWRLALMGLKVVLQDVGYSLNDLNNMSDIQIKTIINRVERSTTEGLPASTLPSTDEVAAREAAAASESGGGSSGGGAPDTSAIDKQIEALQKKIDNIRTEREEVAKLNAEYQKNLEYQQRRLDLENQMREALAGGNLLQYAQLQQEKQVMETQKAAEEAQAKGDKEAENRIKNLEKQIEKLQKQKEQMSSGGGGGGGGGSTAAEEKPKPPYDVATITASIGALAVPFATSADFIKSKVVQPYIKMLKELGYTNKEITTELQYQWSVARQGIVDDYSNLKETMNQTTDYLTMQSLKFRNFTEEAKTGIVQQLTTIMLNPANTKDSAIAKMADYLREIGVVTGPRAEEVAKRIFGYATQENDGGPRDVTQDITDTSKQVNNLINDIIGNVPIGNTTKGKISDAITQTYTDALNRGLTREEFKENTRSALERILIPEGVSGSVRAGWEQYIDEFMTEGIDRIENWPLENTAIKDASLSLNKQIIKYLTDTKDFKVWDFEIPEDQIKGSAKSFTDSYGSFLKQGMDTSKALDAARVSLTNKLIRDGLDPEFAKKMADRVYQAAKVQLEQKKPLDWKAKVSVTSTDLMNPGDATYYGSTTTGETKPTEKWDAAGSVLQGARAADGSLNVTIVGGVVDGTYYGTTSTGSTPATPTTVSVGSPGGKPIPVATGGPISGPGTWTSDSIPAMLSNGEYVVKSSSVAKYGQGMMDAINAGRYAKGGPVGYMNGGAVGFAEGGAVSGTTAFVNVVVSGVTAGTTWMNSMAEGISAAAGVVQDAISNSIKFGQPEGIRSGQDWIAGLAKAIDSGAMRVYLSFQTILTGIKTRVKNTSVQIMAILEETLGKGYTFDIIGKPKMLISEGTVSIWQKVMGETYAALVNAGEVQQYHMGGQVLPPEFRNGNIFNRTGPVVGPGGPTEDKIPAMLSDGEFVVRASSVKAYGLETLNAINEGTLSFARGGAVRKFAEGGIAKLFTGSPLGEDIANWSRQFEGTPYNSGAEWADGPVNGWGCATMTQWLYNNRFGLNLPHPSMSGYQMTGNSNEVPEDMSKWLPGDLLYFYYKNGVNTYMPANHTGMYLGGGSMIHAQGDGIGNETNITGIASGLVGVRRMLPPTDAGFQWPMQSFHNGGMSVGPGGPMDDKIPAMLSNGEFVVRASAVRSYGVDFMRALNQGLLNPAVLKMAANKTFSAPSFNDTMVNASDANVVSINNEFNITGDDPKAIANEVVKVLNTQQRKIKSRSRV